VSHINLLPWRAKRRAHHNKRFRQMVVISILAAVVCCILVWGHFYQAHAKQQHLNSQLVLSNAQLEAQIASSEVLQQHQHTIRAQIELLNQRQSQRLALSMLWRDIAKAVPEGLYLTGIKRQGNLLSVTGKASTAQQVTDLMAALERSTWLHQVQVQHIQVAGADAIKEDETIKILPAANMDFVISSQHRPSTK